MGLRSFAAVAGEVNGRLDAALCDPRFGAAGDQTVPRVQEEDGLVYRE